MIRLARIIALVLAATAAPSRTLHAAAPDGIFSGTAKSNIGETKRCKAVLKWELTATDGVFIARLEFIGDRVQMSDGVVGEDGRFDSGYTNSQGERVSVKGRIGESFSVTNPRSCGYGNLSLKR